MSFFDNWTIRRKLLIPLAAMGILSGMAIVAVSAIMFDDLRRHRIPELLAVNELRSNVLDLVGEYREFVGTPTPGVLDEVNELKDKLLPLSARLKETLLREGHPIARSTGLVPIHDHAPIEKIGPDLERLLAVGDRLVEDRRSIVQALERLETHEEEITDSVARAERVVAKEIEEFRERNTWQPLVEASLPELSALASLSSSSHAYLSKTREYVLTPSDDARTDLKALESILNHHVLDFAQTAMNYPDEKPFIEEFRRQIDNLVVHSRSVVERRNRLTVSLTELEMQSETVQSTLIGLTTSAAEDTDAAASRSLAAILATLVTTLALTLAALVWVAGAISSPIGRLSQVAASFGSGELNLRADVTSRDEAGQLADQFNTMAENLSAAITALEKAQSELVRKERLAAVGQVTAMVSHELRNPLGAIRSASDAIRKLARDDSEHMDRALALLERSQARCDRVITELLNFTRIVELNLSSTAIDQWLAGLLKDCQIPLDIALRQDLDCQMKIAFDHDRLEQAVRNVIENACHAINEKSASGATTSQELTVSTRVVGDRLELLVEDTGSGIAPENRQIIFEPLFSTKPIGVGLGLPTVKQIMEQHDGGIEIDSEPGHGTRVVLWLPLAARNREAAE